MTLLNLRLSLNTVDSMLSKYDSTVYRSDSTMTSRQLCHENDVVCTWGMDSTAHSNYFKAGSQDIALDIPAFDNQLQQLANSTTAVDPRERDLFATVARVGSDIEYNISNTREGDNCRWDVGSDGSFSNWIECSNFFVAPTGDVAKITVEVRDSFNIVHTFPVNSP